MSYLNALPFHESFSLTVSEDATFTSAALCDQAASTIDACWVELHKLQILQAFSQSDAASTPCLHLMQVKIVALRRYKTSPSCDLRHCVRLHESKHHRAKVESINSPFASGHTCSFAS